MQFMNEQEKFEGKYYSELIIKSLHTILNCIEKIDEYTPNYDYIVDLTERVNKQLKNIAEQE